MDSDGTSPRMLAIFHAKESEVNKISILIDYYRAYECINLMPLKRSEKKRSKKGK